MLRSMISYLNTEGKRCHSTSNIKTLSSKPLMRGLQVLCPRLALPCSIFNHKSLKNHSQMKTCSRWRTWAREISQWPQLYSINRSSKHLSLPVSMLARTQQTQSMTYSLCIVTTTKLLWITSSLSSLSQQLIPTTSQILNSDQISILSRAKMLWLEIKHQGYYHRYNRGQLI